MKERLVGAVVLVAAAIILVPEMLSGPRREESARQASAEGSVKTYTIDLSNPTRSQETQSVSQDADRPSSSTEIIAPAPPPETDAPMTDERPLERSDPPAAEPVPANTADDIREKPESEAVAAAGQAAPRPMPGIKPAAPAVADGKWAVQVGSFGSKATAERVVASLGADGFPAFVQSAQVKGKTTYRVRVGPMASRAQADEALKKLRADQPGAAVVAHP